MYDELNRLVRENNAVLNKTITYRYDAGGNLAEKKEYAFTTGTLPAAAAKTITGTFDAAWKDKLLSWDGVSMTYDGCGNMLTKGSTSFTWTQGRKLAGVNNGKSIQYEYDHTGNRVKKVVDGVTTEYRMAGRLLLSEKRADDTLQFHYDTHANLYSVRIGGTRYLYMKNLQNDITGLLDVDGNQVVEYKYDSWGNTVSITGTLADTVGVANPFRYRGYYLDKETGMYYVSSRYYDPGMGRFISPDTASVLTASLSALTDKNLYAYCDNNPVMRKDIGGQFWDTAIDIVSLAVSVAEVMANPADPWAWAGLVGDAIDLIPFVTGVGEVTKAARITVKAVDNSDDVINATRRLYNASGTSSGVRKFNGSYEIEFASGTNYTGKGGLYRSTVSARFQAWKHNDRVISITWTPSSSIRNAYLAEYNLMKRKGVDNGNTYNKIWGPGRKLQQAILEELMRK